MRRFLALVTGATLVVASVIVLTRLPQQSSAASSPILTAPQGDLKFGSPEAVRANNMRAEDFDREFLQLREKEQQAGGNIAAQALVTPPGITEVFAQPTTSWFGLTAQAQGANGEIYMTWRDDRDFGGAAGVYFSRSTDGGTTWSTATRIDKLAGAGSAGIALNIASGPNGEVIIVWDDVQNFSPDGQMFYRLSTDRGQTWGAITIMDTASRVLAFSDVVVDGNGNMFAVWDDCRNAGAGCPGGSEIFGMSSHDRGKTWTSSGKINDAAVTSFEVFPMAVSGRNGDVNVFFGSTRFGGASDLMTAHSSDAGLTFAADERINQNVVATQPTVGYTACSDLNGNVYVFYGNTIAAATGTVNVRVSNDFGATWPNAQKSLPNNYDGTFGISGNCAFDGAAHRAVVAYTGSATVAGTNDVFVSTTADGGATWATPIRADIGSNVGVGATGQLAADIDKNGRAIVAWTDDRTGTGELYMNYSLDNGANWQTSDLKVSGGPSGGHTVTLTDNIFGQYEGATTNDRLRFNFTYHDTRTGAVGLYYAKAVFAGTKGTIARLSGQTRIETGLEISKSAFPMAGSVTSMVIARSSDYPDGLASATLAAMVGGPVLINPSTKLDAGVAAEIKRLFDSKSDGGQPDVYIAGGTTAISSGVEAAIDALDADIDIKRLGGNNRYETAIKLAEEEDALRGRGPDSVMIVTGENFADALTGSAPASDNGVNANLIPVLLTKRGSLDAGVAAYMASKTSSLVNVYILGGTSALSDAVQTNADAIVATVTRIAGIDRYDTAEEIAKFFYPAGSPIAPISVGIATGERFPDSLTGGRHSGFNHQPLLLVRLGSAPSHTTDYLTANAASLDKGSLYGGTAAVSEAVRLALEALI
jgi:putative cell wall-binding protein